MAGDPIQPPPNGARGADFRRRLSLRPAQLLGLALLMLTPVLAVLGVFGPTTAEAEAANSHLTLHVVYPARIRYLMIDSVQVWVRNESAQTLPRITVEIDREFLNAFAEVALVPAPLTATGEAFVITFDNVPPGETRHILVSVRAQARYGHSGEVRARAETAEPVQVTLASFVIP